jgi:hypothetical protein
VGNWGAGAPENPAHLESYAGFSEYFLVGMDLDSTDVGPTATKVVNWVDLDISGLSEISFDGLFAGSADAGSNVEDDDYIAVECSVDGGDFQSVVRFVGNGTAFQMDRAPVLLGSQLQGFGGAVLPLGNSLDLRLSVHLDEPDEDFAVDEFVITGTR